MQLTSFVKDGSPLNVLKNKIMTEILKNASVKELKENELIFIIGGDISYKLGVWMKEIFCECQKPLDPKRHPWDPKGDVCRERKF